MDNFTSSQEKYFAATSVDVNFADVHGWTVHHLAVFCCSSNVEKTVLFWRQKLHPLHGFRAEAPSERQTMQRPTRMTMDKNNLKLAADSPCKGQVHGSIPRS
ncbi:hypothetical protein BHE74_00006519 [Ensete ventricosum]|nr:hypothetical protein GW17_00023729 [Ensete ventricosum]RWW84850.1 hypothetical protein BHE74_00006519 [Ensete ventricosum]RZR86262.1 hypothetical protein BHM03_00013432 [Ensete ventricosum]